MYTVQSPTAAVAWEYPQTHWHVHVRTPLHSPLQLWHSVPAPDQGQLRSLHPLSIAPSARKSDPPYPRAIANGDNGRLGNHNIHLCLVAGLSSWGQWSSQRSQETVYMLPSAGICLHSHQVLSAGPRPSSDWALLKLVSGIQMATEVVARDSVQTCPTRWAQLGWGYQIIQRGIAFWNC